MGGGGQRLRHESGLFPRRSGGGGSWQVAVEKNPPPPKSSPLQPSAMGHPGGTAHAAVPHWGAICLGDCIKVGVAAEKESVIQLVGAGAPGHSAAGRACGGGLPYDSLLPHTGGRAQGNDWGKIGTTQVCSFQGHVLKIHRLSIPPRNSTPAERERFGCLQPLTGNVTCSPCFESLWPALFNFHRNVEFRFRVTTITPFNFTG